MRQGNNNVEQFAGIMDPHIAVHGSFSLMVPLDYK